MRKTMLSLLAILALAVGLAVAQDQQQPAGQDKDQQGQQGQQPQTPDMQQPSSQSQSGASQAGEEPSEQPSGAGQMGQGQAGAQQAVGSADIQQIQSAFQQDQALSNVTVSQSGNKIELSGTVATKADKKKAVDLAKSNLKGVKVVDKIKVAGGQSK